MLQIKTKVSNLKPGDDLGGCTILYTQYIGDYCGQKRRQRVDVKFVDGTKSTRYWGADTTVTVYRNL